MINGDFDKFAGILLNAGSVLLLPHIYADGDALGSCGALAAFLKAAGKSVTLLAGEPPENKLDFLPEISGVDFACFKGNTSVEKEKFDAAVAVDCASPERLGGRLKLFEKATVKMRIDHHASGTDFCTETLLDPEWAATAEGIYLLLNRMGFDRGAERPDWLTDEVEKAVSRCIYTGLLTDTGCFAYSNVTSQTHYIASRVRAFSGDMSFVSHRVYEVKTRAFTRLMKTVYSKICFPDPDVCLLVLTNDEIREAGADESDTSGIANVLRDIEGVTAGIFVKPDNVPGRYRVSIRSELSVDAGKVASLFGGGGHACAAGCVLAAKTPADLESEIGRLLEAVRESKSCSGGRDVDASGGCEDKKDGPEENCGCRGNDR